MFRKRQWSDVAQLRNSNSKHIFAGWKLQGFSNYFHVAFAFVMISQQVFDVSAPILAFCHQLQRSENPSFELLSMSKFRVLSIDEKFPANPKTSFRRILEKYEAICSKYRLEVH